MFDSNHAESTDYLFDHYELSLNQKKKPRNAGVRKSREDWIHNFTRRHQRILIMTEHYRRDNERLRKPCPTCQTLVRPSLQEQHNDAYHQ